MIILATVFGLLKYNIPVIFPWFLKDIIDYLLSAPSPSLTKVHADVLLLFLCFVVWAIVTFYRSYLADQAGQRLIFDLRHELYVHLQRMSLSFFEKRQVGSIASRLLGDIALAQNFVGAAFTNTAMDLSSLLLIAILLVSMNWELAVVALAIFPLYVFLNKHFKGKIRSTSQLAQQTMEAISGDVHEKLGGIYVIQAYTHEKLEEQRFFQKSRSYLGYRMANIKNNALAAATVGFLTSIAPVFVIWYGAAQVIGGHLTVGELAAFYAYLGMFYQPLNRLTDLNLMLANSHAAIDRVYEFFALTTDIVEQPDARKLEGVRGDILFQEVCFGYEPESPILKEIDLEVPSGSVVALVGRSGAGKSTFVKLIPRFYDVNQGAIRIDGVDVRDIQLRFLRRQIVLVPQEPILFSGTIFENIMMGKPDASPQQVEQACDSANALEFITRLPKGVQTEIGEGGARLSGGQKQRIALARAFLKNAPILILDEATSAIDSEAENLIQEALHRLMQARTTFVIAHRLSTIQSAKLIVVLNNGRIEQKGSHAELLNREDGLYRRLYNAMYLREATR
jgi:subfamily B ATP-binding cassette protein MsbA